MSNGSPKHVVIVGGGAAGYFLAANLYHSDDYQVTLLEKSSKPLQKVRISGGGRCNVTHACFDPRALIEHYPRGGKQLLNLFFRFGPQDTIQWFEDRGVPLKTEQDGRVFPVSDQSSSIIQALEQSALENKVHVQLTTGVRAIQPRVEGGYLLSIDKQDPISADIVVLCTGSSSASWKMVSSLGHSVVPPVPSLFTFHIDDPLLHQLSGISFTDAQVKIPQLSMVEEGPLLITHWGLSGPVILRLSAWGARLLHEESYSVDIIINWMNQSPENLRRDLQQFISRHPKKMVYKNQLWRVPNRFWAYLLSKANIHFSQTYGQLPKKKQNLLLDLVCQMPLKVTGKSTFKEEFVTAGGASLEEIDMRSMESKRHENLFFAGEVIDVDAITGGFNFQACWSEADAIAHMIRQRTKVL